MKLSPQQLAEHLATVPGWKLDQTTIVKEFEFSDFVTAFGFMTSAALTAEKLNHHPDWTNVYNKVTVRLTTHSVGGLTELDFQLAQRLDELG